LRNIVLAEEDVVLLSGIYTQAFQLPNIVH